MATHKISKPHKTIYPDPIELDKGDVVILREEGKDEKWEGWIWAEGNKKKGWIPTEIIEFTNSKKGIIKEKYSAKELNIEAGEEVIKIKSYYGWAWVRRKINNEEGWVPDEIIE